MDLLYLALGLGCFAGLAILVEFFERLGGR